MKFIWHNDQWCPAVRSSRPPIFPAIIRDHMEPLTHMGDGHIYDSKSEFRRVTRDRGLIEIGNDDVTQHRPKMPPVRESVIEAIQMLNQGYRPEPEPAVDLRNDEIRSYGTIAG